MSAWIPAMLAAALLSAVATRLAIAYAHRQRLIDQPGARRSHRIPTPRGGGIGIAIAVLACACAPALFRHEGLRLAAPALTAAVAIVAAVGWVDDHRGLPARWRFAAHCVAAAAFLSPLILAFLLAPSLVEQRYATPIGIAWLALAPAALAIVWSINLHNFMDGIDGILSMQAVFVFVALAWLAVRSSDPHAGQVAVFAVAAAGFLPFNFPRARVFMGDVGSGVLGLLIAVAAVWQLGERQTAAMSGAILCSAFVTDATCTLASRMLRGRRWYSAHREHLYQWLARSGFGHAGVVGLYLAWNLAVVAPVVAWINRTPEAGMPIATAQSDGTPGTGIMAAIAVYAVGIAVWFAGKRFCLRAARRRRSHGRA